MSISDVGVIQQCGSLKISSIPGGARRIRSGSPRQRRLLASHTKIVRLKSLFHIMKTCDMHRFIWSMDCDWRNELNYSLDLHQNRMRRIVSQIRRDHPPGFNVCQLSWCSLLVHPTTGRATNMATHTRCLINLYKGPLLPNFFFHLSSCQGLAIGHLRPRFCSTVTVLTPSNRSFRHGVCQYAKTSGAKGKVITYIPIIDWWTVLILSFYLESQPSLELSQRKLARWV